MPSKLLAEWFDSVESAFQAEAKVSGLLSHSSTIGQAREFLIARVLKAVLPANVQIGSGKILDAQGNLSKQIDIVIYDPRFPALRLEGGALYFVEGVLATIEVKSAITRESLIASLENCASVLDLQICGEHPHEAEARIAFYKKKGGITRQDAEHRFHYMFHPATYVFSFASNMSLKSTAECVKSWWHASGCRVSPFFPILPRVMALGGIVGFTNDGRLSLSSNTGRPHVMAFYATEFRFRWLALHIMDSTSQRLGLRNFGEHFDYRVSDYYPLDEYLASLEGKGALFVESA